MNTTYQYCTSVDVDSGLNDGQLWDE